MMFTTKNTKYITADSDLSELWLSYFLYIYCVLLLCPIVPIVVNFFLLSMVSYCVYVFCISCALV